MAHTEPGALITLPYWLGETTVTHDGSEDYLPLHRAEQVWLSEHYAITYGELPGLSPSARCTDEVIGCEIHDGAPVPSSAATALNGEVKKLIGSTVVKPVDDLLRYELAKILVVRENLNCHPLVNDLPDLFPGTIRKGYVCIPGSAAKHDAYLFPQLINEYCGGLCLAERTGDLAQGLGHEPGLQADVAVPHLALDLGTGHQRGDRVDDHDVDGGRADQHVRDFQALLPRVRLGDEQRVGVDAELLGVVGVQRVLRVDERRDPAQFLGVRDGMQRHSRVVRQDPIGNETVRARQDDIERWLKASVLDRDYFLVRVRRHREFSKVAHDGPGTCRKLSLVTLT